MDFILYRLILLVLFYLFGYVHISLKSILLIALRKRSKHKNLCFLLIVTVIEFLTVKMHILPTEKMKKSTTCLDFTASPLSSTTVKMNADTSKSKMSLRNALKIETVLAIQFNEACRTVFRGTRIQATVHIPNATPTVALARTFMSCCRFRVRSY
jgi:hypothetical protein